MLTWSTDELPPKERFAAWREWRSAAIFGVTAELDPDRQAQFSGRISTAAVAGGTLVEMQASSYRVHRSDADVARVPSDSLCIYQQLGSSAWFDTGRGGDFVIPRGGIALSYSDLPYQTRPTDRHGFHLRLLKIPLSRYGAAIRDPFEFVARPISPHPGIGALFQAYAGTMFVQAPLLDPAQAEIAVQTLVQLGLLANGAAAAEDQDSVAAVATGRLQIVLRYMNANLQRPELSPAVVARALGFSVRRLHGLFEQTGTSFSRHLLERRLERTRTLLAANPGAPILDTIFEAGFHSPTVFYRAFGNAYGMTPTEYRALAQAGLGGTER